MMTPNTRVSILERLVPSLAFIVATLSSVVGSVMIFRFLKRVWEAKTAGLTEFFGGMMEIELVVGVVLVFAAVISAIGILVSIIRLFTTNTTASPPGVLFLLLGLLSLVPPFAIHYVMHMMQELVRSPDTPEGGLSSVVGTVTTVAWFAIGSTVVITLILLAFSFIPFSSRPGRKASPLICLILVEILIAVMAGVYFWEARTSMAERNRFYEARSSDESTDENTNTYDSNTNEVDDIYNLIANTNSTSRPKTISGGILNDKAIELPQPPYPPVAPTAVRASGSVSVQVTVNEKGEVTSATAVSGHPLLRSAAVQAARKARFAPTMLSGKPVKVSGVLTYNLSGE